ncbi:MAG: hypothetical protein BGO31_10975 [Bacteroidetes bacterium 43-16]|uniref:DUF6908 domain-containing protein n=1 Tax=uncultured Dysgonomonas sp. TaxID=206096 RepID=UPI000927C1C2|nr:hypothetical protein [uncultured Dysgonomonas sp.]OJV50982.1 MAG: hypothetical protein BGO31_10975 [Bacteroidetes bacterium 43-16]
MRHKLSRYYTLNKRGRSRIRSVSTTMEVLDKKSRKIFMKIIEAMEGKPSLQIDSEKFMPLTVNLLHKEVNTALGKGTTYSLCNYYELDGKAFKDPEMSFIVIDNRNEESKDLEKVFIIPYRFQVTYSSVYELSIHIEDSQIIGFHKEMQKKHVILANQWLHQIKTIRYVNF